VTRVNIEIVLNKGLYWYYTFELAGTRARARACVCVCVYIYTYLTSRLLVCDEHKSRQTAKKSLNSFSNASWYVSLF